MEKIKLRMLGKSILFAGLFTATSLSAGYRTTFVPCPDKPVAVIRCASGPGDCQASDQHFCDEIIIQQ